MKYCIGEFAEILGVTADTLRLYEKHDIIKPMKDHKNNYRYFTDLDARDLLMSRWYRSMQIPLQEAAVLTKGSSLEQINEKVKESQLHLEEEIRKSTLLLRRITEISNDISGIEALLNQCKRVEIPGIYRLRQTYKNDLLKDDFLRGMVSLWMNLLPFTFFSFRIEGKAIGSEENCFDYNWGLAITEEDAQQLRLEIDETVEYIPPKTYLSSVILSANQEYISRDSLQFMLDHIKQSHNTIAGDIIGKIILREQVNGINKTYLAVNIPIEPVK